MSALSVGQQLKQAREARHVSLRDVTNATKIQPWVLEALERDELHATMSLVYVKSLLAGYAKFLKLEPGELLAGLFPDVAPAAPHADSQPVAIGSSAPQALRPASWTLEIDHLWPVVSRLGIGLLAIAAVVAVSRALPLQRLAGRQPRQEASVSISKRALATQANRETILSLQPAEPMELSLVARRPTWVSVKADGKLVAQQQLTTGAHEIWKAKRRFELVIGAPSRVDVSLNGQSISSAAMEHQGRLSITQSSIKPLDNPAAPAASPSKPAASTASR